MVPEVRYTLSTSFNQSAQPKTGRIIELLEEIKGLDLSLPDRNEPLEEQKKQYEVKKRIVKDKIKRLETYVGLDLIQQTTKATKKEEEG
ncbi:unnamed protein product, partial [Onchocerca ochengi]|uniref:Mediator of RNA polymerase II transcription subunit 9 n=1 Tax=Onchocerca ochengi TaxID=42157 RepID=A0A182F071_ONCOC